MHKGETQRQPTSPQEKSTHTHNYVNPQYQQNHPHYYQDPAQYHYNNPQYWQPYQYQQPPVDQQQAQYYPQPNYTHPHAPNVITNVVPSPAQTQYYANRVIPCFIQPSADIPYSGQSKTDSDTVGTVHENISNKKDNRVTNLDYTKKSRKIHLFLNILATIATVAILGCGIFAIFNPFKGNDNQNTSLKSQNSGVEKNREQQSFARVNHGRQGFSSENSRQKRNILTAVTRPRVKRRYIASNRIILTSYPSGALITANGRVLGRTPYTWNNPKLYGMLALTAEKEGYLAGKENIEFTGGTVRNHFNLRKKQAEYKTVAATNPYNATNKKNNPTITNTTRTAQTVRTTANAANAVQKKTPSKPSVKTGTIFLSSIPPYADVYMNGKKIGKTNTKHLKVVSGTYTVKFVKDSKKLTKKFTFLPGINPSQLVRLK